MGIIDWHHYYIILLSTIYDYKTEAVTSYENISLPAKATKSNL